MNTQLKNIDELNAVITVALQPEDYQTKVEKTLQSYRKNVTMKGFRKGMVPAGLVKKMYGNAILVDEINKIVNDQINEYLSNNKVNILGRPLPVPTDANFDINNPSDFSFDFELGIAPEVDLSFLNSTLTVKKKEVEIDDETITKELDNLRSRNGKLSNPETGIQEKDVVVCKFQEIEGGEVKDGGIENDAPVSLEIIKDETLKNWFKEAKVGDSTNIEIFLAFDREREQVLKHILGQKETPAAVSDIFSLTIEKINRMELAELNQEFFDSVFGKDNVTSLEEAKEELKNELEAYLSETQDGALKQSIFETVLGAIELPLPVDFLKRWIKVSNEKPISDEQIEKDFPAFAKNLKWTLIVNKIGAEHKLEGTLEEVKAYSKEQLKKQLKMYSSGGDISDNDLEVFSNSMLAKEEHVKKSYDAVMEQKLFDFIKSQITIEPVKTRLEDFFTA